VSDHLEKCDTCGKLSYPGTNHTCRPQPPKEPQPSQGAGAEEEAEAWLAEQREKRSRWDAMENCYRFNIGIVETWLAGHASGYSKGREEQQKRIAELEAQVASVAHESEKHLLSLRASLALARGALENIAGDMILPLMDFGRGKDMIIAVGEWRREQDRTIARAALSQLPGVEKDAERGSDGNAG